MSISFVVYSSSCGVNFAAVIKSLFSVILDSWFTAWFSVILESLFTSVEVVDSWLRSADVEIVLTDSSCGVVV